MPRELRIIAPIGGRSHFTDREIDEMSRVDVCNFDGHLWGDAGSGLLVCLRCDAEEWDEEAGTHG